MKLLLYIIIFALSIIGGVGYCVYSGAYLIAIAIIALGVMAFPTLYEEWKKFNG